MSLFEPIKFGSKKEYLKPCSEVEALRELEAAAKWLVKNARWYSPYPLKGKLNGLRRPLLHLKLARRVSAVGKLHA